MEDYGKVAASFVDTQTGQAVRIVPRREARQLARAYASEARNKWEAQLLGYQRMPIAELLCVQAVQLNTPIEQIISIFLGLALTNAARLIGVLFPKPVVRGIQLGLGLLLLRSAWTLSQPLDGWVTLGALAVLGLLLVMRREWAALGVIAFGMVFALLRTGWPVLTLAPALPTVAIPTLADFGPALWLLALPQIPLSLANSVYATADAAHQYFGSKAILVTPRRLLTTMGLANVAAALFGGVPVCHGCGGLTAHYRLGARTGGAPLILGIAFLLLGLLGAATLLPLLKLIPFPALSVLLAYVGAQHGLLAKDLRGWPEWLPALTVAITAWFTHNLAVGFAAGAALHFALRWSSVSLAARHPSLVTHHLPHD